MNITSTISQSNAWKRVKLQHLAAAAGAALALGAAIALGSVGDRAGSTPQGSAVSLPAEIAASTETPVAIIYIFGSQAEAAQFQVVLSQHAAAFAETNVQRYVGVASTPAEERDLLQTAGEAAREIMQHGAGRLDVVDMRATAARVVP